MENDSEHSWIPNLNIIEKLSIKNTRYIFT